MLEEFEISRRHYHVVSDLLEDLVADRIERLLFGGHNIRQVREQRSSLPRSAGTDLCSGRGLTVSLAARRTLVN